MKEISLLIVRMATDNPPWGYSRIQGALKNLDHRVARSTVAKVLKDNGLPPAPGRPSSWRTFLRPDLAASGSSTHRERVTILRLWLPLCWMEPVLFAGRAPTLPSAVLRDGWEAFECAASFDEWLADTTDATGWFPAWLLLRHRGLRHLFHSDDIADAGNVARVFRHLLALLPLEQSGLTDELVRQRRALRQLDDRFFRYYMAVLADRRASS